MLFDATFDVRYEPSETTDTFGCPAGGAITVKPHGAYRTQTFEHVSTPEQDGILIGPRTAYTRFRNDVTGEELTAPIITAVTPQAALAEAMKVSIDRLEAEREQLRQALA